MAHNFLLRSRKFDNRHDSRAVDAAPVESWIHREATVLLGERIKARSWVVGVKVFADYNLAEGSIQGVSVFQHRKARGAGAESEIWVKIST